jgi:prepilin-type N-terminal cleavage/methylation domain-containing protein
MKKSPFEKPLPQQASSFAGHGVGMRMDCSCRAVPVPSCRPFSPAILPSSMAKRSPRLGFLNRWVTQAVPKFTAFAVNDVRLPPPACPLPCRRCDRRFGPLGHGRFFSTLGSREKADMSCIWNAPEVRGKLTDGQNRRALTLMELVVVLAVLAAVAAIVAPLLPNLLRRAHKATDATQTSEVSKAVQTYQAAYMSYPDNFDLLTAGTAATFPSYLPAEDPGLPFGGFVQASQLTTTEVGALTNVGIRYVQPLATSTSGANFHPTMNPYAEAAAGANPVISNQIDLQASGAENTYFAVITSTAFTSNPKFLQAHRGYDPNARYVVFGLGARSSMIGSIIQDAPTSVPQNKTFTPDTLYSRVGLLFKVSGAEVNNSDNRARFIGAIALEDDELETTEKDLVGYYQVARDPRN